MEKFIYKYENKINHKIYIGQTNNLERRKREHLTGHSYYTSLIDRAIQKYGIEKIVICGFMTNFCCDSTARHAHSIDYFVDFVVDAMGTPGSGNLSPEETTAATVATIGDGFAVIKATNEY